MLRILPFFAECLQSCLYVMFRPYKSVQCTGKSLSEALIFASTNQQYELRHQYMKILSSEHGENMLCTEIVYDIQENLYTQHVLHIFCKNKSF